MSTKSVSDMTLDELATSDEISDIAREKHATIKEAFENGNAVEIRTTGKKEAYLYQLDNGDYFHAFHCEGRWRRYSYEEYNASIQIIGAINDEVVEVDVEDTKLWHNTFGLYEPED